MTDVDRYYVVCAPASDAVQSPHGCFFPTLEEALESVRQTSNGQIDSNDDKPRAAAEVRIACVSGNNNGGEIPAAKSPRHRFYVDTQLVGTDGDGSERDPWPNVESATEQLAELHRGGKLMMKPNEQLVVSARAVFTATNLERKKLRRERLVRNVLCFMSIMLVLPVIAILVYLFVQALPSLTVAFITENPRDMGRAGGIWAPLLGTFFLVLISLIAAAPVGVLAGVYLNEYARDNWVTRIINMAVVNLAGVPSIVHALFGMGAFVLAASFGQSLLSASLTLGIMTLPVIITSTREALASVPMSFREACWNMGASRWQTIRTIVLPNSISGILTGVILQVARAAGETAPIMFTGAAIFLAVDDAGLGYWLPYGLNDKVMALAMHLFTVRTQIPGVEESVQYGTALVLIALVLAVNSVAIALRVYLRSRKKW